MSQEKEAKEDQPIYDPQRKEEIEKIKARMQEQIKIQDAMKKIRHKIAIMSGKGGVGKTTVAVNLAVTLHLRKFRVGLLDLDMTGPDVPLMLGMEDTVLETDGISILPALWGQGLKVISLEFLLEKKDTPVIWRGPVKAGAMKQFITEVSWGELDYLIMDLPPGTSDEPLTMAQIMPDADGTLIVTTPQDVSILDVSKCINFARTLKLPVIGIIENMSGLICPYCKNSIPLFGSGGGEGASKKYGIPLLGKIPIDPVIVTSGDQGKPFVVSHPDSPASKAFEGIVTHLIKILENQ